MSETEKLKEQLRKKKKKEVIHSDDLLSCGCTVLNLACSGRTKGAFAKGHYYLYNGGSQSGKTFITLTTLAEAAINPAFEDYQLIHDDSEGGALMHMEEYFGKGLAERIQPPRRDKDGNPKYSETAEEFYDNVKDAADRGPFIYIQDSQDALSAEALRKKSEKQRKARHKGKEEAGTYAVDKPKAHSQNLNDICHLLRKTRSILIIVGQARDTIGFSFEPETYSGGRALLFYATLQLWSSIKNKIRKHVKGKDRQVGVVSKVRIRKNRIQGKERTVEVAIYQSFGIDDVGTNIDFLVSEGHWKVGDEKIIRAKDLEVKLKREELVKHIEEEGLEKELKGIVYRVWKEIEDACTVERKKRY